MTADLFTDPSTPTHDPGGKVRLALIPGMTGMAAISACGMYRTTLSREWPPFLDDDEEGDTPFALWIGMNPSVAGANVNDPTVAREVKYTAERLKLTRYVKVNVADYRATDPKRLGENGTCPVSPENLPTIVRLAAQAHTVIAAFGVPPKILLPYVGDLLDRLHGAAIPLSCIGLSKDGWPRHPLYVRGDAPLLPFSRLAP